MKIAGHVEIEIAIEIEKICHYETRPPTPKGLRRGKRDARKGEAKRRFSRHEKTQKGTKRVVIFHHEDGKSTKRSGEKN
jgi:hypothetical protein